MKAKDQERRKCSRVFFPTLINQIQGGIASIARLVDLSEDGICFERLSGPSRWSGEVVTVELQEPESGEVLLVHGEPIQEAEGRVRVHFRRLSQRHRAMLDRFMNEQRLQQFA